MKKILSLFTAFSLIFFAFALIVFPEKYLPACREGLALWALSVLPALLPFFFITLMLSKMGCIENFSSKLAPLTNALYGIGGMSAFVQIMSFISGYPVGARLICELKEKNVINKRQATKMSVFCSTSGPLFVAGTVGIGMLNCKEAGIILLICHLLSAVINGIIFRFYRVNRPIASLLTPSKQSNILYESCYDATISCLLVGTFVSVFYVFSQILADFKILLPLELFLTAILKNADMAKAFSVGIIECTRGCKLLSITSGALRIPLTGALISFGGISIIAQSVIFLKRADANIGIFIIFKIVQMTICFLLCLIACYVTEIY